MISAFSGALPAVAQTAGLFVGISITAAALLGLAVDWRKQRRGGRAVESSDLLFVGLVGLLIFAIITLAALVWQHMGRPTKPAVATATGSPLAPVTVVRADPSSKDMLRDRYLVTAGERLKARWGEAEEAWRKCQVMLRNNELGPHQPPVRAYSWDQPCQEWLAKLEAVQRQAKEELAQDLNFAAHPNYDKNPYARIAGDDAVNNDAKRQEYRRYFDQHDNATRMYGKVLTAVALEREQIGERLFAEGQKAASK